MRRWIALLVVMELAVLAIYVPMRHQWRPIVPLYPERAGRPDCDGNRLPPQVADLDACRPQRAIVALGSYGVLTVGWLIAMYWLSRSGGRLDRRTFRLLLAGSIVLAVSLWALPPTFSDDSYRYRWDGLATVRGFNPYEIKPDSLWQLKATHPQLYLQTRDFGSRPTIYPPFATLAFAANSALGNTLLGWRAMLLACELATAWAAVALLRRRGLGTGWVFAITLCPLLLIETHLDAHVELLGVALMLLGVALLARRRWLASAVLLALAINVKYLWPGLAAMLLLGRLARLRRLLAGTAAAAATLAVCWVPFCLMSWTNTQSLAGDDWPAWVPLPVRLVLKAPREFLERWNFNATFYRLLAVEFPADSSAPKLIVLATLMGLTGLLIWRRRWKLDLQDVMLGIAVALLLSPVSYPWYFLWLLPAVLIAGPGPLWPRVGPPVWAVLWLAAVPALHEFLPQAFATGRPYALPPLPWMIVAAVLPPLTAAWLLRLTRPKPSTDGLPDQPPA